ncbi:MAG: hypothetical protein Q8J89_07810 [Caulobacter sp.]|nr:hypothetical protein [Caulobacter sp.]
MTSPRRLFLIRLLHTVIYVLMAASALLVLFAGLTGARGPWLAPALILVLVESVVFIGFGLKCPLTAVVARNAGGAPVSDTLMPERLTRHTFKVFGPIFVIGLALLALRWATGWWSAG